MKFYAILYWRKISVYLLIGIFGVAKIAHLVQNSKKMTHFFNY